VPSRLHRHTDGGCRTGRRAGSRCAFSRFPLPRSVRIAYDVTPLSHPRTGVGNYILGALKGMLEAPGPARELVVFGPVSLRGRKLLDEALDGLAVQTRVLNVLFAHATRRAWGAMRRPPAERFLGDFDVMHFTDWMSPPQRGGIRATMIHDLGPLRYPERLHPRTVSMHTANARQAANCDVVFTNSSYTANDVVEQLGLPLDRVHVAYPGVDARFEPEGERRAFDRPYVFTTATEDWRKNRTTVELALHMLGSDFQLVALGHEGLGYPSDDELAALYRGGEVFVYPSRFEGFGMPVIEAMACGVPCVVSSHPSLDEACGDAAVRADPESPEEFAEGIKRAIADRDELVESGFAQARRFSWLETGRIHLQSYADAL
jgi:glycosyltransferase involved in cell wall biosynthesis